MKTTSTHPVAGLEMAVTLAIPVIIPELSVIPAIPPIVVLEGGHTLPSVVEKSTLVPSATLSPY